MKNTGIYIVEKPQSVDHTTPYKSNGSKLIQTKLIYGDESWVLSIGKSNYYNSPFYSARF